jgi:hypothetical protein
MIQKFNLQNCALDGNVYTPHPNNKDFASKAKIIHAFGQPKFWNGLENQQWNTNYQAWIQMGGTKYKHLTMKKVIQRLKQGIKSRFNKMAKA